MSSLGEKIAKLTNPTPELILDPEDAVNIDSAAKVYDNDSIQNDESEISDLRRKNAPLLEDVDPTYAGRKVSRRDLGHIFHEDGVGGTSVGDSDEESDDESFSKGSGDFSDDEIKDFKKLVASKSKESSEEEEENDDEVDDDDEEDGDDDDEESSDVDDETKESDEMTKQFSNIDVTTEIERAQAIKNQKEIWNRLLESRIKLQKLLQIINKLPQYSAYKKLKEKGGKELIESSKKAHQSIKHMMKSWLNLQTELINKNREITSSNNSMSSNKEDDSDEEIPSDTEDEMEISNQTNEVEKKGVKRKIKAEDYENVLNKRFKSMIPYRNSIIQKWDEKTRLATGKTQKSFTAFDNSALKQIEQNLQDKARLVRRTQLKRSLYRVLGKPEPELNNSESLEETSVSKQDLLLKDYDPEIFDDDDFYRQILKDVIESKSFGVNAAAIRKQMDIQKMRNKMKRKVDTKASKGRKLRYDVYPKLVNFLAQVQNNEMPDEARESFLKCIFAGMNSS
ncbi:protein AATF-like isoform X1 [Argiope bruennichi]|uniref:protein AATF-like isoform X1 n=1 Tax=Argiope bruennichi TaxID=94029 RepID=UPI002494D62A|nr:protein AATF-like isoform X1 [Argiope bruennichi]